MTKKNSKRTEKNEGAARLHKLLWPKTLKIICSAKLLQSQKKIAKFSFFCWQLVQMYDIVLVHL